MTYATELEGIEKGQVRPLYLLYGEEVRMMRKFEKAVINALLPLEDQNTSLVVLEQEPDIRELINQIETTPFWGGVNVIVVRNTHLFRASRTNKPEKDTEENGLVIGNLDEAPLENPEEAGLIAVLENMPSYSYVIFAITCKKEKKTYKDIDKRRKLYKTIEKQGAAVEIPPLQVAQAREWLQDALQQMGKRMNGDARDHFLSVISLMPSISLGFLENELDKIDLYTGERKVISKQDVLAVMSSVPEASVFALLDAVSRRQTQEALGLLTQQLAVGVHPLILVNLLARQVRMLWRIKDLVAAGSGAQAIANQLKLHPFVAEKVAKQSRSFSVGTLKQAMLALADADRDFKSGQANSVVFDTLVINMCR